MDESNKGVNSDLTSITNQITTMGEQISAMGDTIKAEFKEFKFEVKTDIGEMNKTLNIFTKNEINVLTELLNRDRR